MGWGGKKGGDGGHGGHGGHGGNGGHGGDGGHGGQQAQANEDEELIWNAVTEAVQPILRFEHELDQNKLEKRIRDCFRKGAKGLAFHGKPWYQLINEYADTVFAAVFNSLGDKEWLPQCDFLLCLDAGIKDNFPKQVISRVPQLEFERIVLSSHDRAVEEQRILPILWEVVTSTIEGPKGKKKVNLALEEAWKEAMEASGQHKDAQGFVEQWINGSIARLSAVSQGEPQWVLEPQMANQVFDTLLQAGAMPFALVEQHGPPPPGWQFIGYCVQQAYAMHVVDESGQFGKSQGKAGKGHGMKGGAKSGKAPREPRPVNPLLADVPPGLCRDFLLDRCKRGDDCKYPHDEGVKAEVDLKRALQEAEEGGNEESEAKRARLA